MPNNNENPRQCDCLNHCGDDPWLAKGLADPCPERQREEAVRAERARRSARIDDLLQLLGHPFDVLAALEAAYAATSITWNKLPKLPDADRTVLVSLADTSDEPVWLGYFNGSEWRSDHGDEIDVIAWADLPEVAP